MRLTLSRRALTPCAALVSTALFGTVLAVQPASAADAFTKRVSVEGSSVTDAAGNTWQARTGFSGGSFFKPAAFDVAGTNDDALYQGEMFGMKGWSTPVPTSGQYDVTLRMREAWFTKPGQRVFDVTAEGTKALGNVDIVKAVGARTAYDQTFRVTVSDGRLDLGFSATADLPVVSAISVRSADTSSSTGLSVSQNGTSATLSWADSTSPSKGWYVGRDGQDSTGYGAWGTNLSGAQRSQTFTSLVMGRTYTLALTNGDTGERRTVSVTMGAPATPSPTAPAPTSPTTPPAPAAPSTELSTVFVGSTVTVTWVSGASPQQGWYVGRDGQDSTGYGAWGTTLPGATRSQSFTSLVPGRSYTFTLTNNDTRTKVSKTDTAPTPATYPPTPAPTTPAPAPTTPAPAPTTPAPTTPAPAPTNPPSTGTGSATSRILGTPRSGKPWFSGAWRGAPFTPSAVDAIGTWRGAPMDAVTTYSNKESLNLIANSQWNVSTFNGFGGILSYNLTPIPQDRSASFASVARGDQDWVWRQNAKILKDNGRGTSLVNIGWEMNGNWWSWSATAATAEQYKAAFNRIATVMRAEAPGLKFGFILACGTGLSGGTNRLDAMTKLYPGDANVDVVGCNTYDWWGDKARTDAEFANHIQPGGAPGIADLADFARQRGKGMAIPEWGPASTAVQGSGDNPFFIRKMFEWLTANKDVVVLENYFMEEGSGVGNSLVSPVQMPNAAEAYKSLW